MFEEIFAFIDPVTAGFVISTGAKAIGSLFGSDEDDTRASIDAAKDLSFAETRDTAREYEINSKQIQQTSQRLLDAATTTGRNSLMNLATQEESANTDFASNEYASNVMQNTRERAYDAYNVNVDNIMNDASNQITKLDLNTQKQLDSISAELDKNIGSSLSIADTFTERFLGSSDYKIG
tara:strand:+ start:1074 stop:1613 length:540 start_codon:yes stop_codon:yes gene_type:complete